VLGFVGNATAKAVTANGLAAETVTSIQDENKEDNDAI
jgi:hypothetical protein